MNNYEPISFFHQFNNKRANPIVAHMSTSYFMDLVGAACWMLQQFVNPKFASYVIPQDCIGDGFDPHTTDFITGNCMSKVEIEFDGELRKILAIGSRDWMGQKLYNVMWNQIHLILGYVEMRNAEPGQWIVGEELASRVLVFNTLSMAHNWKVQCIEDAHKKNGKNFGSATGWQKHNFFKEVEDWPAKFGFHSSMKVLVLPGERPGYFADDKV